MTTKTTTTPAPIATDIPDDSEIGESAEDWWDAIGYDVDGVCHPICSFDEIDTYYPETEAERDVARYGRAAKEAALAIRAHIDAAIEAARAGDAATMAEELDAARVAEMDYGDEPSTSAARRALLGEGWTVVPGGVLRYDPTRYYRYYR